ncbi:agmatine deiminase [Butyrivibrio sp. MC2013]|uniref:agmatine deiminase n=1 Tax=Butyrivibrio sp. MC2013 TaxID=1280686 RepID=UPI0004210015|nr:agmatine deiminase [Butyrivibrio sp. MC2013]
MKIIRDTLPVEDSCYMPAEYDKHYATIMIYPVRAGSWGVDRSGALKSMAAIYKEIMKREKLILLVDDEHMTEASRLISAIEAELVSPYPGAELISMESDDAWARDVCPTFVRSADGGVRGINWRFNAWGGEVDGLYASWERDDAIPMKLCEKRGIDIYDADPFVLEGGSIHSDGEGTILVTEACLLSKGRNPSMSKEEIEDKLKSYLGAKKVLWLPYGIYNDETNEHVDNVAAFIAPGEIVLAWTDDETDPQYAMSHADHEYLTGVTDAKGRKLKVHKLYIPEHPICIGEDDLAGYEFEEGEDERELGERLAASYVNYYYINGAILLPQFGGDNAESDKAAVNCLKRLCPDREIIGIPARDILLGGGNIHCITQQLPAAR